MRVVPAGVHDTDVLSVELRPHGRLERHVDLFDHRERVHIGAERHDAPRFAAVENADDAGVRDRRLHLDAQRLELVRDELRGPELAVSELRVLVDVTAAGDDGRFELRCGRIDPFVEIGGSSGEGSGHEGDDSNRKRADHVVGIVSPQRLREH